MFIAIERILARVTDRIVAISESQLREINERYGVGRPEQFAVIPLGMDLEECGVGRSSLRHEAGIQEEEILIGVIGRLCEVKNHRLLMDAAATLLRRGGQAGRARFAIVGDGHLSGDLKKQAEELGISDRVLFTGFRDDVLALC